ncbi:MAG: nuclear transport factor 2 family protein [Myxococcota bacterium]|nr:nuclear transport factor 2 family protein [Myxococcota bacterium]
MDSRLARHLDRTEIKDVIYRYCRGVDRHDLELVRACYHPDASDHHGSFSGSLEEYLVWLEPLLARYSWTQHLIANVVIDFGVEEDVAASEAYGVALHRSSEPKPYLNLISGFRYLDRFERREGLWKVAERKVISEWSILPSQEAWWPLPEHLEQGTRGPGDALYALLAGLVEPAGGKRGDNGS